tara:strand:+ start:5387 stop:5899 length:513 start_codon:yes stop_codon:yes gene_type:complete
MDSEAMDRKLSVLTHQLGRKPEEERKSVLDSFDSARRADVEGKGTAIVGALRKQKKGKESTEEDDYHLRVGSIQSCASARRPYLVNPLAMANLPISHFEDLFGYDIDPSYLIPMLKIWRMEAMMPKEVDDSTWGQFYTRDAYILLWITDTDEKQVGGGRKRGEKYIYLSI